MLQNYSQEWQGTVLVIKDVQEKCNAEIYADTKMKQHSTPWIVYLSVFAVIYDQVTGKTVTVKAKVLFTE